MAKIEKSDVVTEISEITNTTIKFLLVGTSPLILHAMSSKGIRELLYPSPKKNMAERASSMKHQPFDEFRAAAYKFLDRDNKPTRLYMPAAAFHAALSAVAIDMAGATKSQIGRLTKVPGDKIPIWGVPQIKCMIVRSSDMKRTPDVRTVPILPRWAAEVDVNFVSSLIKEKSIINLFANAGIIIGVGDGRPEKGKLDFGCWKIVPQGDKEFASIVKTGAQKQQDAALESPEYFDVETERELEWFKAEIPRRSAAPTRAEKTTNSRAHSAGNGLGRKPRAKARFSDLTQ